MTGFFLFLHKKTLGALETNSTHLTIHNSPFLSRGSGATSDSGPGSHQLPYLRHHAWTCEWVPVIGLINYQFKLTLSSSPLCTNGPRRKKNTKNSDLHFSAQKRCDDYNKRKWCPSL